MNHDLQVNLCRCATARAHLAGAEAAELQKRIADVIDTAEAVAEHSGNAVWPTSTRRVLYGLDLRLAAACRRYWREIAAKQQLLGHPWEKAEALGREV